MMGLPYGEEITIVGRTMWTQSTSVTDGQTDRQTDRKMDRITITKTVQRRASHGNDLICNVSIAKFLQAKVYFLLAFSPWKISIYMQKSLNLVHILRPMKSRMYKVNEHHACTASRGAIAPLWIRHWVNANQTKSKTLFSTHYYGAVSENVNIMFSSTHLSYSMHFY